MASLTQWTWFGWTLGVVDGQGGLVCCDSWGRKESDTTERLNWTKLMRARTLFCWHHMPSSLKSLLHGRHLLNTHCMTISSLVKSGINLSFLIQKQWNENNNGILFRFLGLPQWRKNPPAAQETWVWSLG